ncbi:MAG: hypothetical protein ACUZ8E_10410 [Candidatus Anammoxibacter sp.]
MKLTQKCLMICFLSLFCFTGFVKAEETAEKIESFTIECGTPVEAGFYGVSMLQLELGKETSCTLLLDHKAIGLSSSAGNKLETNLRSTPSGIVVVSPEHGETDGNGRFKFTVSSRTKGSAYVSWAVADKNGKFDFSKEALKQGFLYGMFVKIK